MLERNKTTISYVFQHWMDVESHLKKMAANSKNQFSTDAKAYLEGIEKKNWTRRREKQLLDIHIIVYFLRPDNNQAHVTPKTLS